MQNWSFFESTSPSWSITSSQELQLIGIFDPNFTFISFKNSFLSDSHIQSQMKKTRLVESSDFPSRPNSRRPWNFPCRSLKLCSVHLSFGSQMRRMPMSESLPFMFHQFYIQVHNEFRINNLGFTMVVRQLTFLSNLLTYHFCKHTFLQNTHFRALNRMYVEFEVNVDVFHQLTVSWTIL